MGIKENTFDSDFLLTVLSGTICHHLRDLVTAGSDTEDGNDRKGNKKYSNCCTSASLQSCAVITKLCRIDNFVNC